MPKVITDNLDLWTSALLTKSTAGRGSNGKVEAYGIKKLRELILGTALRGLFHKESESLPKTIDSDVSKARNAYYKSIGKRPKEIDYGTPLLNEFKLPSGWLWKRVGELCDLQTGATPNTHKPEYFGSHIRWLVSGDINQGIIEECEGRISEQGLANSNCKVLPPKTVLIALNGQGKTRASVALLNVPAACNQSLVGMIPFDAAILDPMFLLLSLKYRYYEIRDITGQNQRRGLNMGLVAELSIPLPPLAEQHRIVAKVDELMALCDLLEKQQYGSLEAHQRLVETLLGTLTRVQSHEEFAEAWSRIADHFDTLFTTEHSIDQLKQTILQLAVMGKLIPQDPNDEPARVLLEKIRKEKKLLIKEGKVKSEKGLIDFYGLDELRRPLPINWAWVRLNDIADIVRGGSPRPAGDPRFYDGPIPFLKVADVSRAVGKFVDGFTYTIKRQGLHKTRFIDSRTVLLTNSGATLGIPAICNFPTTFNDGIAAFVHLSSGVYDEYLYLYLSSLSLWFLDIASRGQGQPNLNTDIIKATWFALPPLAEQHRIVAKVDELMNLCDALKKHLTAAQTTQIHLADAIVEQAVA